MPRVDVIFDTPIFHPYWFAISPDGKFLAVAVGTKEAWILETLTGKRIRKIETKQLGHTLATAFSKDGSLLAIGDGKDTGKCEIWDWQRNTLVQTLTRHQGSIYCIAFGIDNKTIVAGGFDGVRIWDIKSGRCMHNLQNYGEYESDVHSVVFNPDGRTFMSLHYGEPVRFWDAATGKSFEPKSGIGTK